MDKESVEKISELLKSKPGILITTHKNPDGDALGSSLALYNYFKDKGFNVNVISPNDSPEFLNWMPGFKDIVNYEHSLENAEDILKEAQIVFCLDFNALSRIEGLGEKIKSSGTFKVMIDHHQQPESFADIMFSDTAASSTCEMVYRFLEILSGSHILSPAIAECLYTGIMTDTGSFRFPSTTAETHRVIANLIECGAKNSGIHERVYDTHTIERTRFLGYCLYEKLTVLPELNTAFIALSESDIKRFNNKKGDTEGIVNYPLSIGGMKLAALFTEKDNEIKISFRSKGAFSVNEFSRKYFGGGGHTNAAGGKSNLTLEETVEKFRKVINEYKDVLA